MIGKGRVLARPGRAGERVIAHSTMESELAQLSSTIRKAGARAKDLAHKGFEIHTKKDRSPVTTADLEVNRILREMQEMHFPDDEGLEYRYRSSKVTDFLAHIGCKDSSCCKA